MKKLLLSLVFLSYLSFAQDATNISVYVDPGSIQETTNVSAYVSPVILQPNEMGDIINYVQNLGAGTNSLYPITSTNLQWVNVIRNPDNTFMVCVIVNIPVTNSSSISTNTP